MTAIAAIALACFGCYALTPGCAAIDTQGLGYQWITSLCALSMVFFSPGSALIFQIIIYKMVPPRLPFLSEKNGVFQLNIEADSFQELQQQLGSYTGDKSAVSCLDLFLRSSTSQAPPLNELFKDYPNLEEINFRSYWNEIPPNLLAGCSALEKMRISNCDFNSIPESLFKLTLSS